MDLTPLNPTVGLCEKCRHATVITTTRESTFFLCNRSKTDPRFAKYPRLPVLVCHGFEPQQESDAPNAR